MAKQFVKYIKGSGASLAPDAAIKAATREVYKDSHLPMEPIKAPIIDPTDAPIRQLQWLNAIGYNTAT